MSRPYYYYAVAAVSIDGSEQKNFKLVSMKKLNRKGSVLLHYTKV